MVEETKKRGLEVLEDLKTRVLLMTTLVDYVGLWSGDTGCFLKYGAV